SHITTHRPHPSLLLTYLFLFNAPTPTHISPLSLHDALPISHCGSLFRRQHRAQPLLHALDGLDAAYALEVSADAPPARRGRTGRSEEHTSELQSPYDLVCRLLLEKKKKNFYYCYG